MFFENNISELINLSSKNIYSIFTGTGSYIPEKIVKNSSFLTNKFFNSNKEILTKTNEEITSKLAEITGIQERRHVNDDQVTSDIAFLAAEDAIVSSNTDRETIDCIIVAHNFGDVSHDNRRSDFVPSIAARIKHKLKIKNHNTVAYDLAFGCPGWLQGVIQADSFIKSGHSKKVLVVGAETLSRVSDPSDIDSMIYSDGAGAVIVEAYESEEPVGILAHAYRSDTIAHSNLLWMDHSYDPNSSSNEIFLKMNGHKLYKYALQTVPELVKDCLDKVRMSLNDIKKVFIHQANEKMDEEILKRLCEFFNVNPDIMGEVIKEVMPMTISWLGNSSVATVPTLYDLFVKGKLEDHPQGKNENYVFASVGAGMNINAIVYKAV